MKTSSLCRKNSNSITFNPMIFDAKIHQNLPLRELSGIRCVFALLFFTSSRSYHYFLLLAGVQPSMMNFGNSQIPGGLIQSQTQSITMFQTQTQHLMGGHQQTASHAQPQQQPTNLYQQQNPTGMLMPQQVNTSMASNDGGSSNTRTFKTADLHDLLI